MSRIPTQIGPYRIVKTLGQGGMGVVYRGEHIETGQAAAVKTVLLAQPHLLASIRREIHTLARIRHPGVVRILDHGLHDGLPWYAMELLVGRSLRQHLHEKQSLQECLTLVWRLCSPLAYLHGEGILHRDLKPENIFLIERDGLYWPVLVDFGLVSQVGGPIGQEVLDLGGMPSGTAAYMSPEQVQGQLLDARADLYSLGCIFYELICGRPPFLSEIPFQVFYQHCSVPPQPPSQLVDQLPPQLDALVLGMLAKKPKDRHGYAEGVATILERLGAATQPWPEAPRPRSYLYRPGFAGRADAVAKLEARLGKLERGQGGLALIGGESGIGKTRLTTEIARQTAGREIKMLSGEGLAPQAGRNNARGGGLHPLRRSLQAVADRAREGGLQETERLLGRRGKVLAVYEPSLAELPGQDRHPEPPQLAPQAARLRLFVDLTETFSAMTRSPSGRSALLLILDDLQWADDLTLGWLEHLQNAGNLALLVLGTYRPEDAGAAALETLRTAPNTLNLELGRLDQASIGLMIADMLALETPPAALTQFLADVSMGNPFFIAEYLRAAVDEGVLQRDQQGRWFLKQDGAEAESFAALHLPTSLHPLALRRLDGLSPAARQLVECVAVLGREGHSLLVWRMAHLGIPELFDATSEVLHRHILEEVGSELLRFSHDQLREVAYASIEPQRRTALHRAAAEQIQTLLFSERQEFLAALGHHWEQAGVLDKAQTAYRAAANKAKAAYAHGEAERLLRALIRLAAPQTLDYFKLLHELAQDVLQVNGRSAEALELNQQILSAALQSGDRYAENMALNGLAVAHWNLGQMGEAQAALEQALEAARAIADEKMESRTLSHLAILFMQQRKPEALPCFNQALAMARQQNDPMGEQVVLGNLAIWHSMQGQNAEAEALYTQVLDLAEKLGDLRGQGLTRANMAHNLHDQGRLDEAKVLYEQALKLFHQAGFSAPEARFTASLAELHRDAGRPDAARAWFDRAIELARAIGDKVNVEKWTADRDAC